MRMASGEISITGNLVRSRGGIGNNALQSRSQRARENLSHAMPRLAKGDDENARVGAQRIEVVANAQHAAIIRKVPGKSFLYAALRQHMQKNLARSRAHALAHTIHKSLFSIVHAVHGAMFSILCLTSRGHQLASSCLPGLKNCFTHA